MEQLEKRQTRFIQAFNTLEMILQKIEHVPSDHYFYQELRDSLIQRFEYSLDTFWKMLKEYLVVKQAQKASLNPLLMLIL
jgi:hypothetical protein